MKRRVAIIDPLGAHGSSHHLYLFGQAMGLINSGIDVSLYTNNETENPKIKGLKFHQLYNNSFTSKSRFFSGIKYILGSILSIVHARITGHKLIHFHIFLQFCIWLKYTHPDGLTFSTKLPHAVHPTWN